MVSYLSSDIEVVLAGKPTHYERAQDNGKYQGGNIRPGNRGVDIEAHLELLCVVRRIMAIRRRSSDPVNYC